MPSLQALSQRLKAVTSTARLTKTMKVVASVKLKVAQRAMDAGRPFASSISTLMDPILSPAEEFKAESPFILAITTDKGMCGGINARIAKEVKLTVDGAVAKEEPVPTVGRRLKNPPSPPSPVVCGQSQRGQGGPAWPAPGRPGCE